MPSARLIAKAVRQLLADWSAVLRNAFAGFWARTLQLIFGAVLLVAILGVPHLIWPKIDIKMLNTQADRYEGRLILYHFDLANGSYLDLKDPEVACDMKGQSGTSIKTVSKVIYEVLPTGGTSRFSDVEMGEIPEQVVYFSCYVKSASLKW